LLHFIKSPVCASRLPKVCTFPLMVCSSLFLRIALSIRFTVASLNLFSLSFINFSKGFMASCVSSVLTIFCVAGSQCSMIAFFNFLVSSDFPVKEKTLIPFSAKYFSVGGVFNKSTPLNYPFFIETKTPTESK
jgi:hypothetical protein